jgi:glucokinase
VVPADGADGIRRQIEAAVPTLLASAKRERGELVGVGIGFGGPVDDATRTAIKSHQIEGWEGFPLADWISGLVGVPAVLGNDADVAGLAEALFGAGEGLSPIFYITIGSGIGGGLIINGEIYRGCGRGAAEIGHLWTYSKGICEPLEFFASGWGMTHQTRYWAGESISATEIARLAIVGNDNVKAVLNQAVSTLAEAICHVIALLCPRRIVIGGGVSLMGEELLFKPVREQVAKNVFRPFSGLYDIVPAELGEEVVVHGALALARKRCG